MTDKEIFETFMEWMGMEVSQCKNIDDKTVIQYKDNLPCDKRFETLGYDEFYAGAIFDKHGIMIKGYLDSHVAHSSDNRKDIDSLLPDSEY